MGQAVLSGPLPAGRASVEVFPEHDFADERWRSRTGVSIVTLESDAPVNLQTEVADFGLHVQKPEYCGGQPFRR